MSTAQSPSWKLRAEARRVAALLKAAERGEKIADDPAGKIAAARATPTTTFAVVMDDKVLKITMAWSTIRETSEAGIAEFIFNQMREARASVH